MRYLPIHLLLSAVLAASATGTADPGPRGVDWQAVKTKVSQRRWAKDALEEMERGVADFRKHFPEPPLGVTGWYHDYFCPTDAARLTFDPAKPKQHACPRCRKVYTGSPYDNSWLDSAHRSMGNTLRQAAALYRITGDRKHLDYVRHVLIWYAENLDRFEVHGKHAGKGRIMSQSLGEARLMADLAVAYWDALPGIGEEDRKRIVSDLFLVEAPFIHKQTGTIHNIHSWHNAAVGLIGWVSGDIEWVKKAVDGPFGMKQQILKGVKEDGFWFEGSIGYHFYTMLSLQQLYTACRAQGYDLSGTGRYQRMFSAPAGLAFDHLELPAMNDGWAGSMLDERAPYFERAAGLWPDGGFGEILAACYMTQRRASEEALLFGPIDLPKPGTRQRASTLFRHSGIAILRQDGIEALLKFSPYGGGHDHLDRLNLIVAAKGQIVIPDLGTPGYGIPLNKSWYRSAAAHNLLVVDGKLQQRCGGQLVAWQADGRESVEASAGNAFPGVQLTRSLAFEKGSLIDRPTARGEHEHQYDLFYHIRGSLDSCSATLEPVAPIPEGSGYKHLESLKGATGTNFSLKFRLRDAEGSLTLTCRAEHPFDLVAGTCPDNPADKEMSVILLRKHGKTANWTNKIQIR